MKLLNQTSQRTRQKIVLPKTFSEDLALETGIHVGDGCMNIYRKSSEGVYTYCGHATDDLDLSKCVRNLMKSLYNLEPSYVRTQGNTLIISYTRIDLVRFKQTLELPLGPKSKIKVPSWIMDNQGFSIKFLQGLFATDGTITFVKRVGKSYPRLKITTKSEELCSEINRILHNLGIESSIFVEKRITPRNPNPIWQCCVNGRERVEKFSKIIGFLNLKHKNKYEEWR